MGRRFFKSLWFGILITTLVGCASKGTLRTTVAPAVSVADFKTLSLDVRSEVKGAEEEVQTLRELLIAGLNKGERWSVTQEGEGQLELSATITHLKRVNRAARLLLGALPGRASVDVDVVLRDQKGALISRFTVTGKSSGGTIFAGTTKQALQKAAEKIVDFMESDVWKR